MEEGKERDKFSTEKKEEEEDEVKDLVFIKKSNLMEIKRRFIVIQSYMNEIYKNLEKIEALWHEH